MALNLTPPPSLKWNERTVVKVTTTHMHIHKRNCWIYQMVLGALFGKGNKIAHTRRYNKVNKTIYNASDNFLL